MEKLNLSFDVPGDDFTRAGEASGAVKRNLKQLGFSAETVRRVAIAMYEGEINMVIHAGGGKVDVEVSPEKICIIMSDSGPGIPDIKLAMSEGYSTATEQIRNLGFGAGMGLPNMLRNCDDMRVESEVGVGTRVYMTVLNKQQAN